MMYYHQAIELVTEEINTANVLLDLFHQVEVIAHQEGDPDKAHQSYLYQLELDAMLDKMYARQEKYYKELLIEHL